MRAIEDRQPWCSWVAMHTEQPKAGEEVAKEKRGLKQKRASKPGLDSSEQPIGSVAA